MGNLGSALEAHALEEDQDRLCAVNVFHSVTEPSYPYHPLVRIHLSSTDYRLIAKAQTHKLYPYVPGFLSLPASFVSPDFRPLGIHVPSSRERGERWA